MLSLIRHEWRLLLFAFLMTFWSAPGQTFFVSLFSGEIRAELGLSDGQFGAIYSLATLLSAIVMTWSGTLVDKVDLKIFSIAAVSGLAIGCGLMSLSDGMVSLFIGIFMIRHMGQGLMFITSTTAVVRYLDKDKGKSTALAGMGYTVSEAVMPVLVVALILSLGWRTSWQITALVVIAWMLPGILFLLHNHHQRHKRYLHQLDVDNTEAAVNLRKRQWTRNEVIRDKYFYLIVPGLMSQPLMFTGFIFHQVHLVESKGWPLALWASLFLMYALISITAKFFTGFWVDRFGAIRLVYLAALPMAFGLVFLSLSSNILWGGVFLALTGITVGFQSTVSAPFWAEMYGSKHLGSIKSMATAVMVFCTAVSPFLFGWLIDLGVTIETLAMASAVYIFVTSLLAYYACQRVSAKLDFPY